MVFSWCGDAVGQFPSQTPGGVGVKLTMTEICESPAARSPPSSPRRTPARGSTSPKSGPGCQATTTPAGRHGRVYVEGKLAWSSTTMSADVIALTQKPVVTDISTEPDVARSVLL